MLLLVAEGRSSREIGETLGVSPERVAGVRQAIRRKLGTPPGVELAEFLHGVPRPPQPPAVVARATTPADETERRTKLLLRTTISELRSLVSRAASRATALEELAKSADGGLAAEEAELLRSIADGLDAFQRSVVARARRSDARSTQVV